MRRELGRVCGKPRISTGTYNIPSTSLHSSLVGRQQATRNPQHLSFTVLLVVPALSQEQCCVEVVILNSEVIVRPSTSYFGTNVLKHLPKHQLIGWNVRNVHLLVYSDQNMDIDDDRFATGKKVIVIQDWGMFHPFHL